MVALSRGHAERVRIAPASFSSNEGVAERNASKRKRMPTKPQASLAAGITTDGVEVSENMKANRFQQPSILFIE